MAAYKYIIFILIVAALSSIVVFAAVENPNEEPGRATKLAKRLAYKVHVNGAQGLPSRGYQLSKMVVARQKQANQDQKKLDQ